MKFEKILTVSEMKQAEQNAVTQTGLSYLRLMENAGSAAYRLIADEIGLIGKRFVLLCGIGNNGGDGFVVARKLLEQGATVTVICTGYPVTEQAQNMYEKLIAVSPEVLTVGRSDDGVIKERLQHCEVVIDAVFGTGFHGALPQPIADLFAFVNTLSVKRVSLDMPSGVNGDSGQADSSAFCPALTISFAALKTAHVYPNAKSYCGEIKMVNIGMDPLCFEGLGLSLCRLNRDAISEILPPRVRTSHKGDYGKLLVVAGSRNMSGAALLSSRAALRSGAGLVTLATVDRVADAAACRLEEATYLRLPETQDGEISSNSMRELTQALHSATACLIGCGMSCSENTARILQSVLTYSTVPVIVDADGINCLSRNINIIRTAKAPVILTPHMGEFSRLVQRPISEIVADRFGIASAFAREWNVTLVLKDYITVIATPDGSLFLNTAGNPGMARGGSGDVLSGIIGSLAAQGLSPAFASAAGVHLHALCGDMAAARLSEYGMLPSDMIDELPKLFQSMNR